MTNPATDPAWPRRPRNALRPIKTPRAELILLAIEADDCPQILLRVLGLVARDGSIPATIEASRTDKGISIAIALDRVSPHVSERIALQVAQMPTVREVQLGGRRIS
jgi:acetolactate synthase regulatory subunit